MINSSSFRIDHRNKEAFIAYSAGNAGKFILVGGEVCMQKAIEMRLGQFIDPYIGKSLVSRKVIDQLVVTDTAVTVRLRLGYPLAAVAQTQLKEAITAHLAEVTGSKSVTIHLDTTIDAHVGQPGMAALPQIKNVIAVGSGKGGVGKSTVAVNLALALAREGARVGLLDADIYGPSQPAMLGAQGERPSVEDGRMIPVARHGIQSMSIGYLIDATAPMVWRGPMIGKALQQLLNDTAWQDLDYLIVDLPPGTGDIQLTLAQKLPVSGALVVTTPQDLALLDVRRACEMFCKVQIPILGVIENMSVYHCPQCGHAAHLFGTGGGQQLAADYQCRLLASVPLQIALRVMTDSGAPPVVADPTGPIASCFAEMARQVGAQLTLLAKDYSVKFPKIVVEQTKKSSES